MYGSLPAPINQPNITLAFNICARRHTVIVLIKGPFPTLMHCTPQPLILEFHVTRNYSDLQSPNVLMHREQPIVIKSSNRWPYLSSLFILLRFYF